MPIDKFGHVMGIKDQSLRTGPKGVGFKCTTTGDYDMDNKRLCNIADPKNDTDAVNIKFVYLELNKLYEKINLASYKTFMKHMKQFTINKDNNNIIDEFTKEDGPKRKRNVLNLEPQNAASSEGTI